MFGKQIFKLVEVPAKVQVLVKKTGWIVGSVKRRIDGDRAPECTLKELVLTMTFKASCDIEIIAQMCQLQLRVAQLSFTHGYHGLS